jgi:hypothetical protein
MAFLTACGSKPSPHIIPTVESVAADLSILMLDAKRLNLDRIFLFYLSIGELSWAKAASL